VSENFLLTSGGFPINFLLCSLRFLIYIDTSHQTTKQNKTKQRSTMMFSAAALESSPPMTAKMSSSSSKEEYKTVAWWSLLACMAIFNIVLWVWTWSVVPANDPYQRLHLCLSGIYVVVCAYRSVLPRIDLERYCLFDSQLSSIFWGRSAATIAEIAFSGQIALLLHKLATSYGHPWAQFLSLLIVPVITMAQVFCWFGVLTLNHVYHAIEESIWAVTSAAVACALASFCMHYSENEKLFRMTSMGTIGCLVYFSFMVTVDVPMYIERWKHGKRTGKKPMSVRSGSKDAWDRRFVTWDWKIWKPEVAWLTGYFSSAVWLSLALVHLEL
jgi:hypothetical protein